MAVGMLLVFGGIYLVREAGQVLGGTQQVTGVSEGVAVALLLVAAALAVFFGFRIARKGF